jgi:phosphoserine phosphatase
LILCSNYAGLSEAEYLHAMDETQRELLSRPAGSVVLTVTDVSHGRSSRAIMAKADAMTAATKAAGIKTIDAVVGIGRLQRPIAQAVRRDLHFAGSLEDAKDWLAGQIKP